MNKDLLSYIPKKYKPYIADFHKEFEEGYSYWLSVKCDSKYHLVGYYSEYTIHEDTLTETLKVFKECIKEK
jgi:hypothetical protein